jgi:hypothetical protein
MVPEDCFRPSSSCARYGFVTPENGFAGVSAAKVCERPPMIWTVYEEDAVGCT